MTTDRLYYLLENRDNGSLTEDEYNELELWYRKVQEQNQPMFDGSDRRQEEQYKSEIYQSLMGRIDQQDTSVKHKRRIFSVRGWSVAAAVMLAATIVLFTQIQRKTADKSLSFSVGPAVSAPVSGNRLVQTLKNSSTEAASYYLTDGSKITLSTNSGITYDTSLPNNRRDIHSFGTVLFNVAKNAEKPFVVYCNNITVTALGTSFTVIGPQSDSTVKIALHEGRVVVKPADSALSGRTSPVFLVPGDYIAVHAGNIPVFISKGVNDMQRTKTNTSITFNQRPLKEALDAMAIHFGKQIIYNEKDISNLDFSGTIHSNDSLESILQRLAVLNGFNMEKVREGFRIIKK